MPLGRADADMAFSIVNSTKFASASILVSRQNKGQS